jgi:hypothetical protein
MHDGAVAPHFVWENTPIKLADKETEETYLKRLMCVLDGRFVCLIDAADHEQGNNNGVPQEAERYRWRYWDNEKHVYQDHGIKWTTTNLLGRETMGIGEIGEITPDPGEFESHSLWMFSEGSMQREFWDAVWRWKHEGSSGDPSWDSALNKLAKQAGVTVNILNEKRLDLLAKEKGWTTIDDQTHQPDMASYRRDGQRINFYLTTGTVGTCLDHPTQNKTQLFRRGIDIEEAAVLLDNPREHTGRGYKRKATDDEPMLRTCAVCGGDKPNNEFCKNQRRKGAKAKCTACAQPS